MSLADLIRANFGEGGSLLSGSGAGSLRQLLSAIAGIQMTVIDGPDGATPVAVSGMDEKSEIAGAIGFDIDAVLPADQVKDQSGVVSVVTAVEIGDTDGEIVAGSLRELVSAAADFVTDGVKPGDVVAISGDSASPFIVRSVIDLNTLELDHAATVGDTLTYTVQSTGHADVGKLESSSDISGYRLLIVWFPVV